LAFSLLLINKVFVQLAQHDRDQHHHRRAAFSSQLKSKTVGNIFVKVSALRITLNIDDTPITSH
jgi:hypothetical protein